MVVAFKEENTVAFKHLFLKGYSGTDEDDYSCSVYTQEDVYESIFFVLSQASVLLWMTYTLQICWYLVVFSKKSYTCIKIF